MIRVAEIFGPTVQGEGSLIGLPTVFVRLGGCDYRCSWCDTMYAVDPVHRPSWKPMTPSEIVECVLTLAGGPILVTVSGGNPALAALTETIAALQATGCTVALETQGSVPKAWFRQLDYLILSPKPPSSGNPTSVEHVRACLREAPANGHQNNTTIKVVVGDETDFLYAMGMHDAFSGIPFVVQPCNFTPGIEGQVERSLDMGRRVAEWVVEAKAYAVRVLPQLHLLWWGGARGV